MFTKKILSIFSILFLLVFAQVLSYGDNDISHKAIRYYAHRSEWLHSVNKDAQTNVTTSITDKSRITAVNTASPAELSEGGGAAEANVFSSMAIATVSLYPLYDKEYFYRSTESEPIRDFRSYDTKTIMPEADYYGIVKHTRPIRDFRDYWPNDNEQ